MSDKPAWHGRDHRAEGADPARIGVIHYVGATDEPPFLNGCSNMAATGAVPDPTPLQFYVTTGQLNQIDGDGNIVQYLDHELTIVGDVNVPVGANGLPIFELPVAYRFPTDRPYHGHDEYGGFVSGRLFKDGTFVRGVA